MDQTARRRSGTPERLTTRTEPRAARMRGRSCALVSGLYLKRICARKAGFGQSEDADSTGGGR
jgi:hypothetical protein